MRLNVTQKCCATPFDVAASCHQTLEVETSPSHRDACTTWRPSGNTKKSRSRQLFQEDQVFPARWFPSDNRYERQAFPNADDLPPPAYRPGLRLFSRVHREVMRRATGKKAFVAPTRVCIPANPIARTLARPARRGRSESVANPGQAQPQRQPQAQPQQQGQQPAAADQGAQRFGINSLINRHDRPRVRRKPSRAGRPHASSRRSRLRASPLPRHSRAIWQ